MAIPALREKTILLLIGILAVCADASPKSVIGYGWEFLAVTTEDVHRNRAKFAETGLDGVILPVDGKTADDALVRGRYLMTTNRFADADFAATVPLLREVTASAGLKESYAFTMLIPSKRVAWDDDAAWEAFAHNMAVVARTAKAGGLKGVVIDHEDYNKARQFNQYPTDPSGTWELARRRGRQVFGGLFAEMPEAKVLGFWMFSDSGVLWKAFLTGMLDVLPPTAKFVDGNENYGYQANAATDEFRRDVWYQVRQLRAYAAPENRVKYDTGLSVSFGMYLDSYVNEENPSYYFPPLGGSRVARLEDNFATAMRYADDLVWVYGEKGTFIDWDRKDDPKLQRPTWESRLPGLRRALRIAAGDGSAIDAEIASGALTNLIANAGCDPVPGKAVPVYGWSRLGEPAPDGIFGYAPDEGHAKPGALKLSGDGCFCLGGGGLVSGEFVYVRAWVKGGAGSVGFDWQSGKTRHWYLDRGGFTPTGRTENGWQEIFAHLRVPKGKDRLNINLSGRATPEAPLLFDDVGIFVKQRNSDTNIR